jgi:hypothetical protein
MQAPTCDADGPTPDTLLGYWCNCVLIDEANGYILRAQVRCRGRDGCAPCCRGYWSQYY